MVVCIPTTCIGDADVVDVLLAKSICVDVVLFVVIAFEAVPV